MCAYHFPELNAEFELWGFAPVQALGTVNGREFYFRSRNHAWELEIALEDGRLPSDVGAAPIFHPRAKYHNASYMPHAEAIELIRSLLIEYLNRSCA